MSTDKPRLVIYTSDETIEKLNYISKENKRSRANMADIIINDYIKEYEKEHGKIPTGDKNVIAFPKKDDDLKPFA